MRHLLLGLISVHGLIHLMGFAKAFRFAEVGSLQHPISGRAGLLWLAGALAFLAAGAMFLVGATLWWVPAMAAIVLSQALIVSAWSDAKFGTVANLIILLPATAALLNARPSSFQHRYESVVTENAGGFGIPRVVTAADLEALPPLVRRYLVRAGVVDMPAVQSIRIRFRGEFQNGRTARPMRFESEQWNAVGPPLRAFLMKATMYGLPTEALHLFRGGRALMQVKVGGLLPVADGRGPVMDQSETVTFFNDLCLFAPGALVDRGRISWQEDGPLSVRATYRGPEATVCARLTFNDAGDLVNFESDDRFLSADGKSFENLPWSTPVHAWRVVDGRRLPAVADAVWTTPEGPFRYARFELVAIEYNPAK